MTRDPDRIGAGERKRAIAGSSDRRLKIMQDSIIKVQFCLGKYKLFGS